MYSLQYTKEAKDNIEKLNAKKKKQVKDAVERIASNPESGKRLSGDLKGLYSFRSGDYRIIYVVRHKQVTVVVVTVGHRQDVYDRLSNKYESLQKYLLNEK